MGRKGWAWLIVGVLFVSLVVILITKSDSLMSGNVMGGKQKWNEETVQGKGNDKVVQLFVEGAITEKSGSFSSGLNAGSYITQLEQARKDKDVKAVVIRVNSPGGEVVASDEIHSKIVELKESGKPVIVSMGSMAASGGYYISAPADYIFANPATLTGSLGVIFSIANYEKAAEWLGYKENTITSGAYKDIASPLREMKPEEREIFQKLVDESYQQFVTVIEKGRKLPRETVLKLADGRIYSGQQAKALGLIDAFGTMEVATAYASEKTGIPNPKVVRYVKEPSLSDLFSGAMIQSASPAAQVLQEVLPEVSIGPRLMYLFKY
ncbi:signal peptide peptidase SppA [Paenibacillus sp. WQ 127069]|uniref:Signal peptide peptidase SppA n=1 Tax=Paenibacillus baimaensis TaxID=2982185 RepID=A0ABT2U897_9BACL|nr:signal peptide peptidase SppA [Paenibacillus sp. WQ 127069]MCU6790747.1 signal peptide peptidase SppA [Paenibacillus sp. WQ 127069]